MEAIDDLNPLVFDDRRAFVRAAAASARADEAFLRVAPGSALQKKLLRAESIAIAGLEGHAVRNEALCRLLGSRDTSSLDRGTKLAADMVDAFEKVSKWQLEPPATDEVLSLFTVSDASSGRLMRPDLIWSLEEDAGWLVHELEVVHETPDPWVALDVLRRIWISGRFQSTARRMAMLCAPWIIKRGFDCHLPVIGLAQRIRYSVDDFREAAKTSDRWSVTTANAVAEASILSLKHLGDHAGEKASLLALCPPERASSSVTTAIEFMIGQPIFTVKGFCDEIGVTPRGAKVVLDKLEEAGVLEVEGGSRNRNYVCRRTL